MPGESIVTALRAFRVRLRTLDKFLVANGKVHGAGNGFAPFYHFEKPEGPDEISELLRERLMAAAEFSMSCHPLRGMIASLMSTWPTNIVYSQLRITPQDPPEESVPDSGTVTESMALMHL
ncbi:hypothetical protein LA080_002393 [Diaporthe eres]|nr:hypothetical protein LA080_002393 [Diaporthe eres]